MSFEITATGTYTRVETPPRCRKPRPISYNTTATATVETVDSTEAPMAFHLTRVLPEQVTEIRTHAGKLYAAHRESRNQETPLLPGSTQFPSETNAERLRLRETESADAFESSIQRHFSRFLIIDGTVWVETAEPSYLVTTFGMGHNHGGTALMVETLPTRYRAGTFRADDFASALAHAIEVAGERGDTHDVARFEKSPDEYCAIEVLIPEAVTLVTAPPTPREVRDLRVDYDTARGRLRSARSPGEETEAFHEAVRLREEIISTGHTPVEPDTRPYEARHEQGA